MATAVNSTPAPAFPPREPWRQRLPLELAVEAAIALLDELDGDENLEPDECAEVNLQHEIRGGARVAA